LAASLLLAEGIVRNFYPQNLSGSWSVVGESGLKLNKSHGTSKHQFGGIVVKYSFGEYHNRLTNNVRSYGSNSTTLVLGDSFTFGWLIPDGSTYVDLLQEHFPNKKFVNAAVGGWGLADYTKYIELFCDSIKPNEIYIYLNTWDITRLKGSRLYYVSEDKINLTSGINKNASRHLKEFMLGYEVPYQWLLENSHFFSLLRTTYITGILAPKNEKIVTESRYVINYDLAELLLKKIASDTANCGSNLKIFYIGWPYDHPAEDEIKEFIKRAELKKIYMHKYEFYDLSKTSALVEGFATLDEISIPLEGHPNILGARKIFEATIETTK